MSFVIAALYHFFDFTDFAERRQALKSEMLRAGIKGSLLISPEGINGTMAGSREAIDQFMAYLKNEIIKGDFEHKESFCERQPFIRTKVRLKKETISLGEPSNPSNNTSHYVNAKDWNALISDPDTIVLDTRNNYEIRLGTFKGAINPKIPTFKYLPDFIRHDMASMKHKKIATFCTGGIRCEKLAPWMSEQGFKNMYQLKGGILKYLEEVPQSESLWDGECYVFDKRVAVGHGLVTSTESSMCIACGNPLTPHDREHPLYVVDLSCPYCPKHQS